jgi:hypothetical protein
VKRFLLLILAACLACDFASAIPTVPIVPPAKKFTQTPEQILAKAVQSIGGRNQLNALESFQLHGIMRLSDDRPVVEVELATNKGGKVLGVMTYIGIGQSRFGSDGETAWEQNLNADNEISWDLIDDSALSQKVRKMNWLEWFTTLPAKLTDMEVVGEEEFDGESCWKVQIQNSDGRDQIAFFSKLTHRPRGRRTVEKTNTGDTTVNVYFRDWERVGYLLLFHTVVYSRDDITITLKLDRIVLNKARESLFILPEPIIQLRDQQ